MSPINHNSLSKEPGKLSLTRVFDAPRELVWAAWTSPEKLRCWFVPEEKFKLVSVRADARLGGKYRIQILAPDGEYYTSVGVYREMKAPERLVFTWSFEKDGSGDDYGEVEPPEMLVTVEFKARGNQTELTLTHEKFASDQSRDNHAHGWSDLFDKLAAYLK